MLPHLLLSQLGKDAYRFAFVEHWIGKRQIVVEDTKVLEHKFNPSVEPAVFFQNLFQLLDSEIDDFQLFAMRTFSQGVAGGSYYVLYRTFPRLPREKWIWMFICAAFGRFQVRHFETPCTVFLLFG